MVVGDRGEWAGASLDRISIFVFYDSGLDKYSGRKKLLAWAKTITGHANSTTSITFFFSDVPEGTQPVLLACRYVPTPVVKGCPKTSLGQVTSGVSFFLARISTRR